MAHQPETTIPLTQDLDRISKAVELLQKVERPVIRLLDRAVGYESPEYIFAGISTDRMLDAVDVADSMAMALTSDARMTGDLAKQRTANQFTARAYVIREEIENRLLASGSELLSF